MNAPQSQTAATTDNAARRRRLMLAAIASFAVIGIAYTGYQLWLGERQVSTDDAYVGGNLVQITPQVGGTVTAIEADDTQLVKAGQPLVKLDPADTEVALQQAQAALAEAVRSVRALDAGNAGRAAQLRAAQTDLARADDALARRRSVAGSGAVGAEELRAAELSDAAARQAVQTAQAQLDAGLAQTAGASLAGNPAVKLAAAHLREAYLAWARTAIPSPVSGLVARRSVQLGQRVAAGTPLMAVVPLDALWVDANFKENQLRSLRIGQKATVVADVYGDKVAYSGRVVGIGAGSGAAFSLLPAQNATGNWIKVLQRVPVRIALDPAQLAAHPLRIGLSTTVEVDIGDQSGAALLGLTPTQAAAQTDIYRADWSAADRMVESIIQTNAVAQR